MKNRLISSFLIICLTLLGLSFLSKADADCVNLYVDFGSLDAETKIEKCIQVSAETNALELLKTSGYTTEGTQKYGDGVLCRLNGLPDKSMETCEVMPPAEAYWAIIIKEKQVLPFPRKEWGWGQLAIDQQYLNPGDSIGLVWTGPKGELKFP
jgi:hypothetical protein